MNRIVRRLFCLTALMLLLVAFMSISVFATLNDAKVGQYFQWCVAQDRGDSPDSTFTGVVQTGGGCPGLSLSNESDVVWISGTPTADGSYTVSYTISYADGSSWDDSCTVTVAPADPVPEYISCSSTFTVGVFGSVTTADCSDATQSCTMVSGSLPVGVSYACYDTYLEISGTPTTPGSNSAVFYCDTEGNPVYFTVNITVADAPVPPTPTPATPTPATPTPLTARKITLQPMAVTVEAGKECQFSANADGKGWCAWRFYKPDGTEVIFDRLKTLGSPYDQVTLEGGNGLYFRVKNVPAEMDGWYVCCLFANSDSADGKPWAFTDRVRIHVTATAAPSPSPTAEPNPTPSAEPGAEPAEEPAPLSTEAPVTVPSPTPDPTRSSNNSHSGLLVLLFVLSAALIAAVVVLLKKLREARGN